MRVTIDPDDSEELAEDLARWRPHQIVELVEQIDKHMGEWDLVLKLKVWVETEMVEYVAEQTSSHAVLGLCFRNPISGETIHQDPHKECILR
jgi:hypothetical protein